MRLVSGVRAVVLGAVAVVVAGSSCASELARRGGPFALINTRVLPVLCVASSPPGGLGGSMADLEAKLQVAGRGSLSPARKLVLDGRARDGVFVLSPAELVCDPYDATGATTAVAYRAAGTATIAELRNFVDLNAPRRS